MDIRAWLDQGLSDAQIADKLGCTVGTLKVRCSQLGISLRRRRGERPNGAIHPRPGQARAQRRSKPATSDRAPAEKVSVALPSSAFKRLVSRARSSQVSESTLAARLLERIVADDLVEAVLDDDESDRTAG